MPDQRVAVDRQLMARSPLDERIGALELPTVCLGMNGLRLHAVLWSDCVEVSGRQKQFLKGMWSCLAGFVEPAETIESAVTREIREEAGIECDGLQLRGTISWPGFGKHGEDWFGFVFLVTGYSGTPFASNAEGILEWIDLDRLHDLPLWDGDRRFLPLVFDDDPRAFHGVMPYRDGRMVSWTCSRV